MWIWIWIVESDVQLIQGHTGGWWEVSFDGKYCTGASTFELTVLSTRSRYRSAVCSKESERVGGRAVISWPHAI
jgi:hypothetical protein